jgi:hypothetical protein
MNPAAVQSPTMPPGLVLFDHLLLGISTGTFGEMRGDWPALTERSARVSTTAIEFSAMSGSELPGLIEYLQTDEDLPFSFVSVHGPTKDLTVDDRVLAAALAMLPSSVDAIVLHPDALREPDLFYDLGSRLVLENMDVRKSTGQTVEELTGFFESLPHAGFCLDVAHAWSIDPTMGLAHQLLDAFAARLTHLHISSMTYDNEHVPLSEEHLDLFAPLLQRCIDVPWILEAYDQHVY